MPAQQEFIALLQEGDIESLIAFTEDALDGIEGEEWQERTADMLAAAVPALLYAGDAALAGNALPALLSRATLEDLTAARLPAPLRDSLRAYLESETEHEKIVALFIESMDA